jgi:hypothetical protein
MSCISKQNLIAGPRGGSNFNASAALAEGAPTEMPPRTKACIHQKAGNEPAFDLKAELFRIAGVDLTDVRESVL